MHAMNLPQFQIQFDPLPNPEAVVANQNVRFCLLTERLIRMEYSPSGEFEDQPSQVFWYRNQSAPKYEHRISNNVIDIETQHLHLRYDTSPKGFSSSNLKVLVKSTDFTWHYGLHPERSGNLGGTYRTLDEASGFVRPDPGLMSSSGAYAYDDSKSLVFNNECWLEPRAHPKNLDIYFFGFGHDYAACLRDFSRIAGKTPLVPRYILGNWWSRYWKYSDQELLELMYEFKDRQIPLSVCIVDMDWHITDTGNTSSGWTGYTWNRNLFPDPRGFIAELHKLGLKTALNLHPAEGIHPHEEQYREFNEFMGLDLESEEPIPFDIADPRFTQGYFDLLHHPMEEAGVDFWWVDWQQGKSSSLPDLDPLWWLNHLHFYDLARDGRKRAFVFSRWGGLGNHRYPIGFSGDTVIGWEALNNQPGFTATATNVGYGWWSHDIGGHMGGIEDDELYTRWVQYGVFSPILRIHSTDNPYHERRPWKRLPAAERAANTALRLRHSLIPYIYSMAWRDHTQSIPLITPLYYSNPEDEETYTFAAQHTYWFGSELLAAPFTQPAHPETGLSRQNIWLPEGNWFDFFSGERLHGSGWCTVYGLLDDIPVYAKAGAIIPLSTQINWVENENPTALELLIFPGADNIFELYEDDGETNAYLEGKFALTKFAQTWNGNSLKFTVSPSNGEMKLIPEERNYLLHFRGITTPEKITIRLNGSPVEVETSYQTTTETLELAEITLVPTDKLRITMHGDLLATRDRVAEKLDKYLFHFKLESWEKKQIFQDWARISEGELSLSRYRHLTGAQRSILESLLAE
jgi:alpha-glucosidase (family GH31 glycosyl hydrolase)